ncbi:hypothetical protein PG279_07485 [Riemerella anatipestifer]|nr:hypothetical protein [Riemerella anatipestifer]
MNNLQKIGNTSEVIAKIYFKLLVIALILLCLGMMLQDNSKDLNIINILASLLGTVLLYYILKFIFKPLYSMNRYVKDRLDNKISSKKFRTFWWASLFCTIVFALLPILPTFGISILIMIPQFILLFKTKNL